MRALIAFAFAAAGAMFWMLSRRTPGGAERTSELAVKASVTATLDRYMVAARAVHADSVSAFYTTDATLFEPGINPIQGRDSIRAFMASFPGVKVEVAQSTADTIEVHGNTVYLWGSYFERLAFPGQPVSEQHGKFIMEWVSQPDGTWLIHRYYRVPRPSPPPPPPAK